MPPFTDPITLEEEDAAIEGIESIAKEAAAAATQLQEGGSIASPAKEVREAPGEKKVLPGSTPAPVSVDAEVVLGGTGGAAPAPSPVAPVAAAAAASALALVISQQGAGAPSSSGVQELDVEDEITWILLPLTRIATSPGSATDNLKDFAFLEAMSIGFKDVQERYNLHSDKLREER